MDNIILEIIDIEWEMLQKVQGRDGRTECQEKPKTFMTMRASQFYAWNLEILESYREDLENARIVGRNLLTEKYAYMMKYTDPEEYEEIKAYLPLPHPEKEQIAEQIIVLLMKSRLDFDRKYPKIAQRARGVSSSSDNEEDTSYETYLRGELFTYSLKTTQLLFSHISKEIEAHNSFVEKIMEYTVKSYGYSGLEEAEQKL